jgi:hypothetical protein
VVLCTATVSAQGVDVVYVTYPEEDAIFAWNTVEGGPPVPIFTVAGSTFEDLVVGPDGDIWACDPDPITGQIVKLTPNFDPSGEPAAATLQETYPLRGFQCGWFTHYGDLIVTKKNNDQVYFLPFADPGTPQLLVDLSHDGSTVAANLEGLTQEADGDLLVVDRLNGWVARVPFDLNKPYPDGEVGRLGWFDVDNVTPNFITGLSEPVGIARSSEGDIFVTDSTGVYAYDYVENQLGELEIQLVGECPDLGVKKNERPYFLEFAADDTLYISMTRKNSTELVRSGLDCASNVLSEIDKKVLEPPAVGMAVPYLAPAFEDRSIKGKKVDPNTFPLPDPTAQVFTFNDHAFEFKAEYSDPLDPRVCDVEVWAAEVEPDVLQIVIDAETISTDPDYPACLPDSCVPRARLIDTADPDYPGCLDANTPPCDVAGSPVLYLGENGRGIIYEAKPIDVDENDPAYNPDPDCFGTETDPIILRFAANAFSGYVPNPRLVKCPSDNENGCELLQLSTFFPFDGVIPEDARIATQKVSTTASDFSRFFIIDVDLNEDADTGDGYFCGFENPWTEPDVPDWNETDVLADLTQAQFNQLTVINNTETFTFKFQIAQRFVNGVEISEEQACANGPYIEGATVLMSIARVADDDYPTLTEVFRPKSIFAAGSSAEVDPAIFNEGALPNKKYNFNAKFPNDGFGDEQADDYVQGVYQVVLVPLTNNFPAQVRYFRIVE